jgi:hypothetical protein
MNLSTPLAGWFRWLRPQERRLCGLSGNKPLCDRRPLIVIIIPTARRSAGRIHPFGFCVRFG